MNTTTARRADKATCIVLVIAATWSVGLLIAAAVAPAYGSSSTFSSGPTVQGTATVVHHNGTATLVQVNGLRVLAPIAVPLFTVGVVTFSLWRRRQGARPGAGPFAWTEVVALGGVTFLSMLSIGLFLLPVDALLIVACARA